MRGYIRRAYAIGTVEHTSNEDKALARIAGAVGPTAPDKFIRGIANTIDMGHHSANDDGDEHTGQDEHHAQVPDVREGAVREENGGAADPRADDEAHEHVPWLGGEVGMEQSIHGNRLVSQDCRHGGGPKDPRQGIPVPGKPSADPTIFARGDRGPMVDW